MDGASSHVKTLGSENFRTQRFWSKGPMISSFCAGILASFLTLVGAEWAGAFNLASVTKSVTNLIGIKKNLDNDIKMLTSDAKKLIGSKDQLLEIKDKLMTLAKDTRSQVDTIQTLVGQVESQLKQTEQNIATTAGHVGEIDKVRKALGGD
jgi:peptidoglycan hydrolase CwlO-like protein